MAKIRGFFGLAVFRRNLRACRVAPERARASPRTPTKPRSPRRYSAHPPLPHARTRAVATAHCVQRAALSSAEPGVHCAHAARRGRDGRDGAGRTRAGLLVQLGAAPGACVQALRASRVSPHARGPAGRAVGGRDRRSHQFVRGADRVRAAGAAAPARPPVLSPAHAPQASNADRRRCTARTWRCSARDGPPQTLVC
jgi:hypothetical protein